MNEINGNGAYLIRMSSNKKDGSKRYTLSIKVHEGGENFRARHYQIKREDEKGNKGKFLLEPNHRFIKIEDLLDHYRSQRVTNFLNEGYLYFSIAEQFSN